MNTAELHVCSLQQCWNPLMQQYFHCILKFSVSGRGDKAFVLTSFEINDMQYYLKSVISCSLSGVESCFYLQNLSMLQFRLANTSHYSPMVSICDGNVSESYAVVQLVDIAVVLLILFGRWFLQLCGFEHEQKNSLAISMKIKQVYCYLCIEFHQIFFTSWHHKFPLFLFPFCKFLRTTLSF